MYDMYEESPFPIPVTDLTICCKRKVLSDYQAVDRYDTTPVRSRGVSTFCLPTFSA